MAIQLVMIQPCLTRNIIVLNGSPLQEYFFPQKEEESCGAAYTLIISISRLKPDYFIHFEAVKKMYLSQASVHSKCPLNA